MTDPDDEKLLILHGKFPLGKIIMTRKAKEKVSWDQMEQGLRRHCHGDWGDLGEGDRQSNDEALKNDEMILSAYKVSKAITFWVITEHDRSVTTILMPEDY